MSNDSRSTVQIISDVISNYTQLPHNMGIILRFREMLMELLMEKFIISLFGIFVITTDPMEDSDDDVKFLMCYMATTANLIVIISNGFHNSDERLEYLKKTYPNTYLANLEFDQPFYRLDGSWILLKRDGYILEDINVDGFVNAGPCHSKTLESIAKCLVPGSRVITVGANDDSSLGAGINQKQTDEPGKLISIRGVWVGFIDMLKDTMILRNLSVHVSRYVLFPNPITMPGTFYSETMGTYNSMSRFIANIGMFFASRPPPNFGLRVNEGNSIVDAQFIGFILPSMTHEQITAAYAKIEEYKAWSISLGLKPEYYESATLPIFLTYGLGGIYKPGMFGWGPGDEQAKMDVSCLTPESAVVFKENLGKLPFFTPAYDVIAFLMLLGDFE
jgi:hypothetical protein